MLAGLSALGASALLTTKSRATAGPTSEVAAFVCSTKYDAMPSDLIELSKKHILDALGLALAGEKAESGPLVRRYLSNYDFPKTGSASVLGTGIRTTPRLAAFANGVAIHADDYDDTQLAVAKNRVYGLLTHPTVTALSAALAVAEAAGRSGQDVLLAYHVGVEAETKIAEASNPRAYETGFHSTGLFGVFGATIAAAKLANLDEKAMRVALGIAGAQASGLRENFGTMTKPFQAGHAAECGIEAADLAAIGWTAAENILEGQVGLYAAAAGGFDASAISGKLGRPWTFLSPGISIKPHPSGSLSHPAMDAMQHLIAAHNLTVENVASIRVGTNHQMLTALFHHRPKTGLEAKFSMEYCMAVLLLDGKAGLKQFTDEAVNRPAAQALLPKVDFYNDPRADQAGADKMRSFLEIKTVDGKIITGMADFAKGSPQFPMSFSDVKEKFFDCAEYAGLSLSVARDVVSTVQALERVADIRNLTHQLTY